MATAAQDDLEKRLWFSPEIVILRAQKCIFRVFVVSWLGSLRQHVALPQPPESEEGETIRGVPVVNMHDDPAELELF
jgi:hypothetical protein